MKYRKKPVVIEAVQLLWGTWNEMCDHIKTPPDQPQPIGCFVDIDGKPTNSCTEVIGLRIPTLEGEMLGTQGDWIIRGIKGELYPCKPDIFAATYELVGE